MANREGQRLGNYQLMSLLGQGGFAEVYLGRHLHLNTYAAIKVLQTQLAQEDFEAFRIEAQNLAQLVHPNIIRVLDFGVEGQTPFLVMDYASNGTLRQRHPRGMQLPLEAVVTYTTQIADALQYAHEANLIHRDIKPENMLLGQRGEILLSDFGIATIARNSRSISQQDIAGTIPYMAPEQIQGRPRWASDQYALGIVVYEWLCGYYPFHGAAIEIVTQHLTQPPPSLREKLPMLPPEVELVVKTTLAKDPKDRFMTVKAFATALDQASQITKSQPLIPQQRPPLAVQPLQTTNVLTPPNKPFQTTNQYTPPVQHFPNSTMTLQAQLPQTQVAAPATLGTSLPAWNAPAMKPTEPQAPGRRISRRAAITGIIGGTIVVVGGGLTALVLSQRTKASPSTLTTNSIPMGTTLYIYKGHSYGVNDLVWSPNGKRIASGSSDKTVQVWNAVDGGNVYTYQKHSNYVDAVAWSPDGKRIASGSEDNTVQVWNAVDGGNVYIYQGHSYQVITVAWSPDGKRIASGSADKTVQVWDAADGGNVYTFQWHTDMVTAVAWSPNGKRIASGSADNTVQVWDAIDGNNVYTYQGHTNGVFAVAWSPDGKRITSGSGDKTVQVWDAADGGNVYTYHGHSNVVGAVAWSPDSKRITSGGLDHTVQVWDAFNGSNVYTYRGHSDSVDAVAWSPDGKRIASGSEDKTVQVWQA